MSRDLPPRPRIPPMPPPAPASLLRHVLDLLLPPRCAGCGAPYGVVGGVRAVSSAVCCAVCAESLARAPGPHMPSPSPPDLPVCWSAAPYAGAVRGLLLAYKERGRTALAPVLGGCLAAVAADAADAVLGPDQPVVLTPIPSSRAARRARGHDPVRAMASRAVRVLRRAGRPAVLAPVLRHSGRVADQAGLTSAERAANLSGAFRVPRGTVPRGGIALPSGPVLRGGGVRGGAPLLVLVDDVVTTGSTLAEAARALRAAGAVVPLAVTIAATERRLSD